MICLNQHNPLLALGMCSLVLGFIGLMLFFMPILGIPISIFGLICGGLGFIAGFFAAGPALRWSIGGLGLCGLALVVNMAIALAPQGYLPSRAVPQLWQAVPGRPYVPPPAQF